MKLKLFTTLFALMVVLKPYNGYSQFTDTLIQEVNYRLFQGAEAREKIRVYQKLSKHDSITIQRYKSDLAQLSEQYEVSMSDNRKKCSIIQVLGIYSILVTILVLR